MSSTLRCAHLVARYPEITSVFVQHEVRALRELGAEVHTVSIRRQDPREVISPQAEREQESTHALLPTTAPRLLGAHARAFAAAPGAYLRTLAHALRLGPGGSRNRLWQLFYFAESMLLWHHLSGLGVRHVHVHFANVASDVAMLCTRFANAADARGGWTWSLTIHGPTELLDMKAHKLADKVRAADAVVCTSDFVRSQLMGLVGPADWHRLHTLRSGIDLGLFHPPAEERPDARRVEILDVAGMSARKGHAILLEALAEVERRGANFGALLVGDGPERPGLEAYAEQLGIADRVYFAGALGQHILPELYRQADVFCLPSYAEGVPTVLMEAMASELPVVTTHVMGVPELVEHGRSGFLVPPARADLLADELWRLVTDRELRLRIGRAARERVESGFDLRDSVAALERLLSGVANRPGPVLQ
ncbi:MAG: glycosyltransferase family 4 protein [Actinomycetota bacterium]|nr:glycosyltransferase family 4 protein [Actinomycetota bacterium]